MQKIIFFSALFTWATLMAHLAGAQNKWTPEQQEVWKTETTISDLVVKGDIQGAQQYLGDDMVNWPSHSPVPIPRSSVIKWQDFFKAQGGKILFFDLIPMVIWVKGDFAYVYYHQRVVFEPKNGKPSTTNSRWMDALTRKGDKWVVVGDFGGPDPVDK